MCPHMRERQRERIRVHETAAVVQVAFPRFNFNVAILFACDRTQAASKSKRGGKEVGWKRTRGEGRWGEKAGT